jgi:hypothetical protein
VQVKIETIAAHTTHPTWIEFLGKYKDDDA